MPSPKEAKVYVTFDSWYSSEKLIRYCLRQGWHVICDVKRNRSFNGVALEHQSLRGKRPEVKIGRAKQEESYLTYQLEGCLSGFIEVEKVTIVKRDKKTRNLAIMQAAMSRSGL